jgi:hypothetical protein
VIKALPSLSTDGADDLAPKYLSSKESNDAAAAVALVAALLALVAAAEADVAELDADVAELEALVAEDVADVCALVRSVDTLM